MMASNNQDKKTLNDILYDFAFWSVKNTFKCICGNKALGDISDGALCEECFTFVQKLDTMNVNQRSHLINYIYLDSINKLKCKCGQQYVTIDKQLCNDCTADFNSQKQTIIKTFERKKKQMEQEKTRETTVSQQKTCSIACLSDFPVLVSPHQDILNQKNNEIEELRKKLEELTSKSSNDESKKSNDESKKSNDESKKLNDE
jgi:hypothetical protein